MKTQTWPDLDLAFASSRAAGVTGTRRLRGEIRMVRVIFSVQ
jgi:hypothetical protein